jgi:hypothetical protein
MRWVLTPYIIGKRRKGEVERKRRAGEKFFEALPPFPPPGDAGGECPHAFISPFLLFLSTSPFRVCAE